MAKEGGCESTGRHLDSEAFRAVFDASPQGVIVHRRHKPLYVNQAWASLHGYETGEVLVRDSITDLISPEDRKRLVVYNSDRLAGRPAPTRYHYQIVHRDGRLLWVEIFVQQLDWFGEPAVQCTVIDVRHRDEATAEMLRRAQDANERFAQALEESHEGFALFDSSQRLVVWNRRFIKNYPEYEGFLKPGLTFEDMARHRLKLGLIPDAVGQEETWLKARLRGFGQGGLPIDMQSPDGRWFLVGEKRITDGSILMSSVDITERREAEQALAHERSMLRAIIDNIPEAIYAKDREGRYTVKNRFDACLMGAETIEETIGKSDFDYYPEEIAREFHKEDMQVIEQGLAIIAREQRVVRKGREATVWLSATKVPLKNADGEVIGLVGCSRDITEQKELQLDLARHRDHLEEIVAARTAEVERQGVIIAEALERERELNAEQRRFVSLVSHEFRTPLAIIDGLAQRAIRRDSELNAGQRVETLEKIRTSVTRLIDLMETVLSSASLEAGSIAFKPVETDLKSLIKKACESQQEIKSGYSISLDIDALPECSHCDPKLMHQVITNLISNAIKYSPDADHVDVTGFATEDGIEIAVRDFGVGIPEGELPKLFQRFFRASTSEGIQGTGIGLNFVKAVIEMHGGEIAAASIEGEGSTFTVKLPHQLPESTAAAAE